MGKAIHFALASTLVLASCGNSSAPGSAYQSTLGTGGGDSSSATGTGGAGAAGCVSASISIEGDGPTNHLGAACLGSWGIQHSAYANGYLGYPEPNSAQQLFINGCVNTTASPTFGSLSLTVPQTMVGSVTTGKASYANGLDTFTTDTEVTVMVSKLDSKVVQGTYTATVSSPNNGVKMLSGDFSVCRVPDFLPP